VDNLGSGLEVSFRQFINSQGVPLKIDLQSRTYANADYDDAAFAASGTQQAGSCIVLPLSPGGDDAQFLAQGIITLADKKVFIPSGVQIESQAFAVFQAGSYSVVHYDTYQLEGNTVYTRAYMRSRLP